MNAALLCLALFQTDPGGCRTADPFPEEARTTIRVLDADFIRIGFPDRAPGSGCGAKALLDEVAEYYREQSNGVLQFRFRHAPNVQLRAPRSAMLRWNQGGGGEIKVLEDARRSAGGKHPAAIFLAAGGIGLPESALWPHSGSFSDRGRTVQYTLVPENARGFELGALAHEIGHLLGLPDQYGIDAPAGELCLMGTGYLGSGRDPGPGPLCASCRSRLGWIPTHTLTPGGGRTVRLDPGLALRIPLTRSGSESLLLETRPGRGLVVWHEEEDLAPGLIGVFPTAESDRLTPFSEPAFRARTVGSRAVYLTGIRFERGSALLEVGSSAPLTPQEELRRSRLGRVLGGR